MRFFWLALAKLFGRNFKATPMSVIAEQMNEKRLLPTGRQAFEDWSDRIISGALLTADVASQKFALADMLLHLGPTVSQECDVWFISCLRKHAVNQVAVEMRKELHEQAKARLAEQEKTEEQKKVEASIAETEARVTHIHK